MKPALSSDPGTRRWHLVLVLLGGLLMLRLVGSALYPLMDNTEARYADIGRVMWQSGDWVTPWIEPGVPFWGKPPLSFWITALSFGMFGINEFAARLPHFLAAVLTGWMVWGWAREHSRERAISAITLLGGASLMLVAAGAVMTDMTLAACTTLAMRGFWQGLHGSTPPRRHLQGWLFFVGLGLGLLAKGPLVLVLAGLPLGVWALARPTRAAVLQRLHHLWQGLPWIRGTLLMLAIAAPWYVLAEVRSPGFLDYFLVGEHWHRFVTPGWSGDRYGTAHKVPRGSIWPYAAVATLPWSFLLPLAAWRWRRTPAPATRPATTTPATTTDAAPSATPYLLLWSLAPLVFFSFAGNILWTYALPALPALALLGAAWLDRPAVQAKAATLLAWGLVLTALGFVVFVGALSQAQTASAHTAKFLVQHAAAQHPGGEPLLFFQEMPYSASFYSQGRAQRVSTTAELAAQLQRPSPTPRLLAIRTDDLAHLPPELRGRLGTVAQFGGYTLLATRPASSP